MNSNTVNFKVAEKLFHVGGYHEEVNKGFFSNGTAIDVWIARRLEKIMLDSEPNVELEEYKAPTFFDLNRWLINEHGYYLNVYPINIGKWNGKIYLKQKSVKSKFVTIDLLFEAKSIELMYNLGFMDILDLIIKGNDKKS